MTHQIESSIIEELLKVLSLREPNGLRNTLQVLLNAAMKAEQEQVLKADHYERSSAPDLATWLEGNVPQSLTVFQAPAAHRRMLRTTNMVEQLNREIKKRTRIASILPKDWNHARVSASMRNVIVRFGLRRTSSEGGGMQSTKADRRTWLPPWTLLLL